MIDVNIWDTSATLFKKPVKHGIFGPLLASESKGEKVGHANLMIEVDERSKNYALIEDAFTNLLPKKTLNVVPTPVIAGENWSHLAPKTVKSNQFTHSFWPKDRPSTTSIFLKDTILALHLRSGKMGYRADFKSHDEDMRCEDNSKSGGVIKHKNTSAELIQREKAQNINFCCEIDALESNLEQLQKSQEKLNTLKLHQVELRNQHERMTQDHQGQMDRLQYVLIINMSRTLPINLKIGALERTQTYLSNIQYPDAPTKKQFLSITQQIATLRVEQQELAITRDKYTLTMQELKLNHADNLAKSNEAVKQNEMDMDKILTEIKQLEHQINGRNETDVKDLKLEWRRRVEYTSRKEQFLITRDITQGKHPDHVIKLPHSTDGVTYYLDELKILEAMEKERGTNYSFIYHNCASSAKRCLLAGISEPLRKKLIESGLSESFFKVNTVETCSGLKNWTKTLEGKLIELNFSVHSMHKESDEPSSINSFRL